MRIGIDARLYKESGIGRYIRNLLSELQKLDKKNEYYIFLLKEDYQNLQFSANFKKILANFKWYGFSEQIRFPILLNKYKLDLLHVPHFNVPIFYRGKFVVTIHDLIHQKFQMRRATRHDPWMYKIKTLGYNKAFTRAIKKSEKILVPSNYVKKELVNFWNLDTDKVVVTFEAVDENILKLLKSLSEKESQKILENLKVTPPYIFYIGNAHPHKNVEGLIKAFLEIRKKYKDPLRSRSKDILALTRGTLPFSDEKRQSLKLVLSGGNHYFWERVKKEYKHPDIIYTGFVSDEELVTLYKNAQAFVWPSFEEGFGIPVLEAFACGCPVVASDRASIPEVGGEGALYFDPTDSTDMKDKIMKVLNDDKLKKDLVNKGKKRYQEFSWQKLAKETLDVYKESID